MKHCHSDKKKYAFQNKNDPNKEETEDDSEAASTASSQDEWPQDAGLLQGGVFSRRADRGAGEQPSEQLSERSRERSIE